MSNGLAVFLGAGFSKSAGLPLASELFDDISGMDRQVRARLAARVVERWQVWRKHHDGGPEQYLTDIQPGAHEWGDLRGRSVEWEEAVRLIALNIVARMAQVNRGRYQRMAHHDVFRASGTRSHELFWDVLFGQEGPVSVLTTNYDILAERGIRAFPLRTGRRRVRPGFHYGFGAERLHGGNTATGYNPLRRDPVLRGSVPLLKLHGSVSWQLEPNGVRHHFNCWPGIHGTPAIIAPVEGKEVPTWARPVWEQAACALREVDDLLVVGYSLPSYDDQVRDLLRRNLARGARVHVVDPNRAVVSKFRELLPDASVVHHGSFPEAIPRFLSSWGGAEFAPRSAA